MTSNSSQGVDDEVIQKYHAQIFEMVNSRLTEALKFYAPLISRTRKGVGSLFLDSKMLVSIQAPPCHAGLALLLETSPIMS